MYILSVALWYFILQWVSAEDAYWIGGVSGNWNEAWRWSTNSVPTTTDTVYIVEDGNYTVTLPHGVDASMHRLILGSSHGNSQQVLIVEGELHFNSTSIIKERGSLRLRTTLKGSSLLVFGELKLMYQSRVDVAEIDILEGGMLYIDTDICATEDERLHDAEAKGDGVLGMPLATGEISITIPSTFDVDKELPSHVYKGYVNGVEMMLSELAGGCTTVEAEGNWVSSNRKLVKEKITVVTISVEVTEELMIEIRAMAVWLARVLKQEAIFLKVNHQSYLIKPTM